MESDATPPSLSSDGANANREGDPLFGNDASDLLRGALNMDATLIRADPRTWQPPEPHELQKLLTEYEITAFLGRGGMGAVYRGRQISLDRAVAIKILPPGLEQFDPTFAVRFQNEALAMARLNHLNIVSVYDFGETADGMRYIVMECVEGSDVACLVRDQRRLHSAQAVAITAHVCDALQYAHERGIIHRDIKPANIMLGRDGSVKVADFGLAKIVQADKTGLTRSGMAMGTLHYIAPEVITLGLAADHRADIYAVGVMLYHLLTGTLPQGAFESASSLVPGLDPRFDAIIAHALRNDRDQRYQSAGEMRHALDAVVTQPVAQEAHGAHGIYDGPTMPVAQRAATPNSAGTKRPPVNLAGSVAAALAIVIAIESVLHWPRSGSATTTDKTPPAAATSDTPAPSSTAGDPQTPRFAFHSRGASRLTGSYRPRSAPTTTTRPASIRQAPDGLADAEYGEIKLGPAASSRSFAFIIDQPDADTPRLFFDKNANGDLTDDPPAKWMPKTYQQQDGTLERSAGGEFEADIDFNGETLPATIGAYRFHASAPNRPHGMLLYYSEYYRSGAVMIGWHTYPAALTDDECRGDFSAPDTGLRLDFNGDGFFNGLDKYYKIKDPFKIDDSTFEVAGMKPAGESFKIIRSSRQAPEIKILPKVVAGKPAPSFDAVRQDGAKVAFPSAYKGKIVLLDFWASWCPPCVKELPVTRTAFEKHHAGGLEILGISLDEKEKLQNFLKKEDMPWPQICDGLVWKAAVAQLYGVASIPATFLVDGDTGIVLAAGLRGDALEPAIAKALADKKR